MKRSPYVLLICAVLTFAGCSKDDESNEEILDSTVYPLTAVDNSGVTGKATFTKGSKGTTEVLIKLDGSSTSLHPAFIRFHSAEQGGDVALTLTSCECNVGHTVVTKLDNGDPIDYAGLLKLDGHISIHESPGNLGTVVASANIGANAN